MNKIAHYIVNGKGIGGLFLFFASLLYAAFLSLYIHHALVPSIPHIQAIADEVLPITLENGKIVMPQNTLKELNVLGEKNSTVIPLVLDTTLDSLDTSRLSDGIYITRSYIYSVNGSESRSYKFNGSFDLPKQDYTEILKIIIKWVSFGLFILYSIVFFICFLVFSLLFAFMAQLANYINKRELSFDAKMRLSALLMIGLSVILGIFSYLGYQMGGWTFFAVMIALQIIVVRRLPQA